MAHPRQAVHRTLVVVDVERFGDQRRTNFHQLAVRDGLWRALARAFDEAGIRWAGCRREDRGDGVLILARAAVPKARFTESLPDALAVALEEHNRECCAQERIRLRMALHAGEVSYDCHGVAGAAVNLAFRLVEARPLKAALASSPGVLAVIASSWLFEEVIKHSPASHPDAYRPVQVAVKETSTVGWICLPGQPAPPGQRTAGLADAPFIRVPSAGGVAAATRTLPRDIISFTGREAELRMLVDTVAGAADHGEVLEIFAVGGMAGIGKTAFAVHAAHRLTDLFSDGQIFLPLHGHTPGQRPVDPADALASLLQTAGVAIQQIPPGLEARARLWRAHLADKRVLLLLDDALGHDQIRPLLPGTAGSLVLVTSRTHLTALEDARSISLDTLPPEKAAELLVRLAARHDINEDNPATAEIARLCGYLPLAVGMLARQLHHHSAWTAAGLASELAAARDRLEFMTAENLSVAAAFDLSYRDLTADQQRLFRFLGVHPGIDFDYYAIAALEASEPALARRHLDALYDHYLLSEPTRGRYRLHDLIRARAQSLADTISVTDRNAACDRLLDYYLRTACAADRFLARRTPSEETVVSAVSPPQCPNLAMRGDAVAWMEAERLNLHAMVEYAATHDRSSHAASLPTAMHGFLRSHHYWDQALTLHRMALSVARHAGDPSAEARSLTYLGDMQYLTDDYPAATASLTLALELYKRSEDLPGEADALSDLGFMQRLNGDYRAAAASLGQALKLWTRLGNRSGEAWALTEHGLMQSESGDYPAAAHRLARALKLYRELGDQLGEARALNYLGSVQCLIGDYPSAASSLAKALELHRHLRYRLGEARAYKDIGMLQTATGEYQAAVANLTRAVDLYRELRYRLGEIKALSWLGTAQRLSSDNPAAATSLNHALELSRARLYRPGQAEILNGIGELSLASGNIAEAKAYHQEALTIARDIAFLPEEARALEGIGRCCVHDRDPSGIESLGHALTIYRQIGSAAAERLQKSLHEQRKPG